MNFKGLVFSVLKGLALACFGAGVWYLFMFICGQKASGESVSVVVLCLTLANANQFEHERKHREEQKS